MFFFSLKWCQDLSINFQRENNLKIKIFARKAQKRVQTIWPMSQTTSTISITRKIYYYLFALPYLLDAYNSSEKNTAFSLIFCDPQKLIFIGLRKKSDVKTRYHKIGLSAKFFAKGEIHLPKPASCAKRFWNSRLWE